MYYDYAEQVLAKGPNSEECSRMYNIAEQKLYEVCSSTIKQDAFQWDVCRPPQWPPLDVTTGGVCLQGGSASGGGSAQPSHRGQNN